MSVMHHPAPAKELLSADLETAVGPDLTAVEEGQARAEERRWLAFAATPAVGAAVLFAVAIASGVYWALIPAVLAVLLGIVAVVYVTLSSDTNGAR